MAKRTSWRLSRGVGQSHWTSSAFMCPAFGPTSMRNRAPPMRKPTDSTPCLPGQRRGSARPLPAPLSCVKTVMIPKRTTAFHVQSADPENQRMTQAWRCSVAVMEPAQTKERLDITLNALRHPCRLCRRATGTVRSAGRRARRYLMSHPQRGTVGRGPQLVPLLRTPPPQQISTLQVRTGESTGRWRTRQSSESEMAAPATNTPSEAISIICHLKRTGRYASNLRSSTSALPSIFRQLRRKRTLPRKRLAKTVTALHHATWG
mmetsp:Transcript_14051/g.24902  ORF Transcript_14051/g.24902 Transcript_14051/m.24902 type:complete len:262 (-) Transcript_14051:1249-2034(-)